MTQLLFDVNIVVDLCVERDGSANSRLAVALARTGKHGMWVYTGSVQTLEYVVAAELYGEANKNGEQLSRTSARARARHILQRITADYQWLAALADEGDVFVDDDPEDAQLLKALERFPADTATLLTRDSRMLNHDPERGITPEAFIDRCRWPSAESAIDFVDLKAQQAALRPQLEQNIHRVLHHGHTSSAPKCVSSRLGSQPIPVPSTVSRSPAERRPC